MLDWGLELVPESDKPWIRRGYCLCGEPTIVTTKYNGTWIEYHYIICLEHKIEHEECVPNILPTQPQ